MLNHSSRQVLPADLPCRMGGTSRRRNSGHDLNDDTPARAGPKTSLADLNADQSSLSLSIVVTVVSAHPLRICLLGRMVCISAQIQRVFRVVTRVSVLNRNIKRPTFRAGPPRLQGCGILRTRFCSRWFHSNRIHSQNRRSLSTLLPKSDWGQFPERILRDHLPQTSLAPPHSRLSCGAGARSGVAADASSHELRCVPTSRAAQTRHVKAGNLHHRRDTRPRSAHPPSTKRPQAPRPTARRANRDHSHACVAFRLRRLRPSGVDSCD